jgi:hypothetical protein
MTMKNINYTFLLLTIIFNSCKKEDNSSKNEPCSSNPTTTNINATDLLNCRYKTGTYWLYVDSITGSTDSVSIDNYNQDFMHDICNNSYQAYHYSTVSYPSMKTHSYVVVAGGIFKDPSGVNTGTHIYDDYHQTYSNLSTHYDSMFVFNQYYHHVAQTIVARDPTENNYKTVYYINSDFGFLRMDLIDSGGTTISRKILMQKNIIR